MSASHSHHDSTAPRKPPSASDTRATTSNGTMTGNGHGTGASSGITNGHGNGNSNGSRNGVHLNDSIASLKSESMPASQRLMMGVPPASTPVVSAPIPTANGVNGTTHKQSHLSQQQLTSPASHTKGKARQVDPLPADIPLSQLEAELPLEEADLIPLAALVERVANHGYEALQNLAETLPSLPSSSRRTKIYTTALEMRKQFIKLLVLVKWSRDVNDLQRARNIISLLVEQQWQHEDVFAGLTDVRKILPNARMRNADLPTAIDVLRTGTYRRLPASIKDNVVPPKPFSDQEALDIVTKLQDALRLRMACREIIPTPMSRYHIQDGKVHFHVPGLFEADLTASGNDSATVVDGQEPRLARWWLLDLKFDVRVTGANSEKTIKLFPRKPRKEFRERLRIWGDRELEPRGESAGAPIDANNQQSVTGGEKPMDEDESEKPAVASSDAEGRTREGTAAKDDPAGEQKEGDKVDQEKDGALAKQDQPISSSKEQDAPLVRLFAFLQERSLHYQLDILQHQAIELTRLNWGSNLRIHHEQRPRSLTLHYWTQAQSRVSGDAPKSKEKGDVAAALGGSIRIAITDQVGQTGKNRIIADLLADTELHMDFKSALTNAEVAPADEEASAGAPFMVKRRQLKVTWNVAPAIREEVGDETITISSQTLDVEQILNKVTQMHASALLRVLQKQILIGNHPLSKMLRPQDCRICSTPVEGGSLVDEYAHKSEYLRIDLQGSSKARRGAGLPTLPPLRLLVDPISGKVKLQVSPGDATGDERTDVDQAGGSLSSVPSFRISSLAAQLHVGRLEDASERVNSSIDLLPDVLYRLEIFARVEEWERKAAYLGLRTVRKLNFKPQEYAKFGPSISTCGPPVLYVPLGPRFQAFYLALQPSEATGVNVALISATQMIDGPVVAAMVLQSIEWLDRIRIAETTREALSAREERLGERKRNEAKSISTAAAPGRGDLTLEELASLHTYSVALVSYSRVEQQLRARGIPYMHVGNLTSRPGAPIQDTGDEAKPARKRRAGDITPDESEADVEAGTSRLVPTICLRATDLLGFGRANLVKRNVSVSVRDWWHKDRIRVEIRIKLRMKSRRLQSFRKAGSVTNATGESWLDFDGPNAVLTYSSSDLDNCVVGFLAEWERVSKAVELAREVLNVGRAQPGPRTLALQDFNLESVTFSYATNGAGQTLLARVRWLGPACQVDFGVDAPDPFGASAIEANAHNAMSFELRRTLNASCVWRGFFQLLRDTYPLIALLAPFVKLSLTDANTPELEVRSATWFRLRIRDVHALDIRLVTSSRYLICDAAEPLFRSPTKGPESSRSTCAGQFTPIDQFASLIPKGQTGVLDLRRAMLCDADKIATLLPTLLDALRQ